MANYLIFANPKGKPIMTVGSLQRALDLSWNCGYYLLPQSDYRVGIAAEPELASKPQPEAHSICCANCGTPEGDVPMTLNLGLSGNTWLCQPCMIELEQPQPDYDED